MQTSIVDTENSGFIPQTSREENLQVPFQSNSLSTSQRSNQIKAPASNGFLKQKSIGTYNSSKFDQISRPDEGPQTKLATSASSTLIGGLILGCAILGGSSIGVLANFIPIESALAKNAWRSGLNVVMFIIPALVEFFMLRKTVDYKKIITFKDYCILLVTLSC